MNSKPNPRREKAQRAHNNGARLASAAAAKKQLNHGLLGCSRIESLKCRFTLLSLLFVCFACFVATLSAPAATFTTNALITEADTSFDGQDIVVSGATLTVDGRHSYPCS
jgi:hypothetical protein